MKIIRKSKRIEVKSYDFVFEWRNLPGAGFSFPCNEDGTIDHSKMYESGEQNLKDCLEKNIDVIPLGVQDRSYSYFQPALGKCECGEIVDLYLFTNTCECGREYNSCGQLLAPRILWREGTDW